MGKNMTTSLEIESELNNLFGEEFVMDEFYSKLPEGRGMKDSVLSRVAEEVEDLLL